MPKSKRPLLYALLCYGSMLWAPALRQKAKMDSMLFYDLSARCRIAPEAQCAAAMQDLRRLPYLRTTLSWRRKTRDRTAAVDILPGSPCVRGTWCSIRGSDTDAVLASGMLHAFYYRESCRYIASFRLLRQTKILDTCLKGVKAERLYQGWVPKPS
jgi:hypothetical protein